MVLPQRFAVLVALFGVAACADQVSAPRQVRRANSVAASATTNVLDSVTSVSTRLLTVCADRSNGATVCWGKGSDGQIGDGNGTDSPTPVSVAGGFSFRAISASDNVCALTGAGVAYCWGFGIDGELGTGSEASQPTPTPVSTTHRFVRLAQARQNGCAITLLAVMYCWGFNGNGELGVPTTGPQMCSDGPCSTTPVAVSGGHAFSFATVGSGWACGITVTGALYCWGRNLEGELGNGSTTSTYVPTQIAPLHTFINVTASDQHTCAVTSLGRAACWGNNDQGQLGDGTTTSRLSPVPVSGGHTFRSLSTGEGSFTCGVTPAGAAYCWGDNTFGQLGDGTTNNSLVPVAVSGGLAFREVAAGADSACGLTTASTVYCWGSNVNGALGDGSGSDSLVPVPVAHP
jgi:alpha-tubulin suppressor-like RCC1 family protein